MLRRLLRAVGPVALSMSAMSCASGGMPAPIAPPAVQSGAVASAAPTSPGYMLVWADEINGAGPPDARNWDYERGFVRNREFSGAIRDRLRARLSASADDVV